MKNRYVPLLALGAAYCFLVMMFNVPIPDGTTAHAVGAVLIAVLLGPWAAVIAVSIGLLIQALFFGDGGVLAYGANCVNMAVVMPFVGYAVYRLLARRHLADVAAAGPRRGRGWLRRAQRRRAGGGDRVRDPARPVQQLERSPLYAPFHLSQTIPAMLFAHLLVAGVVEAALTFGVIAYLQRANVPVLRINHDASPETDADVRAPPASAASRWALLGLGAMAVLTPLGLLAPGGAFGEDAPDDLDLQRYQLSAVPSGLRRYADFWHNSLCLDGYGFERSGSTRRSATSCRPPSASLLIGLAVVASSLLRLVQRRSAAAMTRTVRHRRVDTLSRRRAGERARLAARARGRAVPVRLHRQAQQGQLRRRRR